MPTIYPVKQKKDSGKTKYFFELKKGSRWSWWTDREDVVKSIKSLENARNLSSFYMDVLYKKIEFLKRIDRQINSEIKKG